MKTLRDLDSKVFQLCQNLNVKIVNYQKAREFDDWVVKNGSQYAGLYSCALDYIGYNEDAPQHYDLNDVVLHEITHWSGHPKRLARKYITNDPVKHCTLNVQDLSTEEAIAQMGMYKLACILGLDQEKYKTLLDNYLTHYPLADLFEAERESDRAVDYILRVAGVKKVA